MTFKLLKQKKKRQLLHVTSKTYIFFCTLLHAQIMANVNSSVQQHAYRTATSTGHMVFYCISPLAIYTKDSGPAASSIITPFTTDAHQPCMNWDREQWKKKKKKEKHIILLRTRSAGTQVGQFKSGGQSGPLQSQKRRVS